MRRIGSILDGTAEIVRARRADRAASLRHLGAGEVLRINRAPDAEPGEVAIAHVAQRETVEGLSDLLRLEAADRHAIRPFVAPPGVGALHVHARELLEDLERAGPRRLLLQLA